MSTQEKIAYAKLMFVWGALGVVAVAHVFGGI